MGRVRRQTGLPEKRRSSQALYMYQRESFRSHRAITNCVNIRPPFKRRLNAAFHRLSDQLFTSLYNRLITRACRQRENLIKNAYISNDQI